MIQHNMSHDKLQRIEAIEENECDHGTTTNERSTAHTSTRHSTQQRMDGTHLDDKLHDAQQALSLVGVEVARHAVRRAQPLHHVPQRRHRLLKEGGDRERERLVRHGE